jgi:uncharacterized spore protein YtfJ
MNIQETIEKVTNQIEKGANVKACFGEAQKLGNKTIIPVAEIKFGGGMGGGKSKDEKNKGCCGEGGGGGLGVKATPIGYIEEKKGDAIFVPIVNVTKIALFGIVGLFVWLLVITRFFRK